MGITRSYISDFGLANPFYEGSLVTAYRVNPVTHTRLAELAPLYTGLVGPQQAANPQRLDSEGKWQFPIYVAEAVILVVGTGEAGGFVSHETGIVEAHGRWAGPWAPGATYFQNDVIRDGPLGSATGNLYLCAASHVSDTSFPQALTAGLWVLYVDVEDIVERAGALAKGEPGPPGPPGNGVAGSLGDAAPQDDGLTASPGTSLAAARDDHRHKDTITPTKGQNNGIAPLDAGARTPWANLPEKARSVQIVCSVIGKPAAGALLLQVPLAVGVKLEAGLLASFGSPITAPSSPAVLRIAFRQLTVVTNIGTITYAPVTGNATFSLPANFVSAAGDVLLIYAPATQDTTLDSPSVTLVATLT